MIEIKLIINNRSPNLKIVTPEITTHRYHPEPDSEF